MKAGDVAFRCNFGTVDGEGKVLDRRAGRIKEGTREIARDLDGAVIEGVDVRFKEGTEHRAALLLRGEGLDPRVSDGDPHDLGAPLKAVKALAPEAERTAQIVNEFTRHAQEVLAQHPVNLDREKRGLPVANAILVRGAGRFPDVPLVAERWGVRFAAIAGVALIKGICRAVGMEVLEVEGATGGLDTDMKAKVAAAMSALDRYDVVVVNIKAADIAAHDHQAGLKAEVLGRIDDSLAALRKGFQEDWIFGLTGDHSTPCETGDHSADPVPFLVYGGGVRRDRVTTFDELSAAEGGLGRIRGVNVLPILLDLANRSGKFGA